MVELNTLFRIQAQNQVCLEIKKERIKIVKTVKNGGKIVKWLGHSRKLLKIAKISYLS